MIVTDQNFEEMNFLGERDGHFYYLSKFKTHGSKAFAYSTAFGGNLVKFETQAECEWVHEQTKPLITSPYYIGLTDADHPGRFTWEDHTDPTFNKFEGGIPTDIGDNVVTNAAGNWLVVDGVDVEAYYVLEVSDPCGLSDEVYFCCEDAVETQQVVFRAIDYFGRVNECMVNVEVQDKVAPRITCPDSQEISCTRDLNLEDLSEFGMATATDQCGATITDTLIDMRSGCAQGNLIRRFTAADNNGSSTCDQVLTIINDIGTVDNTITWPEDFTTDMGCNAVDLHPDSLAVEFGRPRYNESGCNQLVVSYDEQRFSFAGPGSDACLKILRRWTVIDWCQRDDPDYEPATHDQVIKVNNTVGPEILTGCDTLNINTDECLYENVSFSATATDDCTPAEDLRATIQIDTFSDGMGTFDIVIEMTTDEISFDGLLPIGNHFALISFADQCNNVTTCTKIINVNNITIPTAACVDGITIALEPMDLDGDGTPDTERACIFPEMLDASSTHVCGTDINLSFSADTSDTKIIFDCNDIGIQTVTLWVTDSFGNTAACDAHVDVQDNNNEDFCPRFDLALVKTVDATATPGPYYPGDDITYQLEVINQGNIPAFDIGLVDYIPDGLTLNDTDWTANMDGTIATLNTNIAMLQDSMSTFVDITFTIDNDFMGFSITNTAEISTADDDDNPNNEFPEDPDSNPDMDNDDVIGGNDFTDSGNGDEDDHDPEDISVEQTFDLSLTKECVGTGPFMPGSTVTYRLTVTNEGTINATNVELADYIPAGLILSDTDWNQSGNVATLVTPIPLVEAGQSSSVDITFMIDDMFMNQSIVNTAEIIDPNNLLLDDEDSTPGNDDGDQSEDDEASKMIVVGQVFDLAIVKLLDATGPFDTGADVPFTITVYNQGSLDATDVRVVDYVPTGMTFDPLKNTDFNVSGSDAEATVNVDSDESVTLNLVLTIDADFAGDALINTAEIVSATNALGLEDQDDDLDNVNTGGTNPELTSNNDIDDERPGTPGTVDNPNDEDDYDLEVVDVNCILLPICNALSDFEVILDANGMATVTADQLNDGSTSSCTNETVTVTITSSNSNFTCSDLGSGNIVTLQATDSNGNVSTNNCETNVTVVDNIPPTVSCQDVTVMANNAGEPLLVESTIVTASDDNCFVADTTINLAGINIMDLQCTPMNAELIVTDQSGNTGTCTFMITIENDPPVANCNTPLSFDLDANGMFTLTPDQVNNNSTDDCSMATLNFALDQTQFDCTDVGMNTVVLTVTDTSGSTDTCSATVNINDVTDPEAICQDVTVQLDANGAVTVTAHDVDNNSTDACGGLMISLSQMSFDCTDLGDQNVVLTVTDVNGNTDTCEATVTIEDDIDPTVTCVAPMDITLDANGMATITVDQYISASDDNCGVTTMTSSHPEAYDCDDIDLSPITVTVTVGDSSGNTGTCEAMVTILDNVSPECTLASPVDIAALATITLDDLGYSSMDNCTDMATLITNTTIAPEMFDCDDLGSQTVVVTVTDESGNMSTCSASVNVIDETTPICVPQDITVELDQMGQVTITADQVDGGSTAGCDNTPTLSVTPDMFDCDDAGMDIDVVLTITSSNMQSADCDAVVTVVDNLPPTLTCATDTILTVGASGSVNILNSNLVYTNTDNCGNTTLATDIVFLRCDLVNQATIVTFTATDDSGNTTTCQTEVTPIDDVAPTCELVQDLTIAPDQIITIANILSMSDDNCDDNLDVVLDQNSFDCMMLGMQTITATVTDDSGNTNTCTAMVDVVDLDAPVCQSFTEITVNLDVNGEAVILVADIDSMSFAGCSGLADLSITPDFYACNDVGGSNITTLTVTDGNGVTATCETIVNVFDTIPPVITCSTVDTLLFLDANGMANFDFDDLGVSATDGCDLDGIALSVNSLDCTDKGTPTIVVATATDENDNTATCEISVSVDDNMAPTCTLLDNLVFPPNVTITETDVLDTFEDNCATSSSATTVTPDIFDCTMLGVQTITVTVTDDCGNTGSCTADVEIVDNSMPICVAQDITVSLTVAGNAVITAEDVDGGSTAACGNSVDLSVTPTVFDCSDQGDNIVTLTVTASGGDSASCTAVVTIVDDLPPTIVCPVDMTIDCNSDISNLDIFGDATISDNCDDNPTVMEDNVIDVNACNVGTVERIFTATDENGNSSTCMQTITIDAGTNPIVESDITWPTSPFDLLECVPDANNIDSGMPIVDTSNADCFNISITFEDFGNNGGNCDNDFTRVWTVTDSCQTNGVFTFNQFINIDDMVGPDVSGPMDMEIILPAGVCDTFLNLPATVTDCTGGFTAVNDSPFADSNATADASGTYEVGSTTVNVTATDACGNDSIYTYVVNVIDTTVLITDCAKIIDNIDASLMVEIDISQADVQVDADCGTNGIYTFSFSNTDPTVDVIIADCSYVGFQDYTVYLYLGTTLIDSCTNLLQIVDGGAFCTTPLTGNVIGEVITPSNTMLSGVSVDLMGSGFESQMTDEEGEYAFPEMPFGGTYMVKPVKDVDYLNGVSTLDLIEMQKHIIGTRKLDSPYKLIAADVNNSGDITSLDLLELRKLILGIYEELPDNTSWRMVDKSHNFIDPQDPFSYNIPEEYEIFNFTESMKVDFVGVKIGDVNNSAQANIHDTPVVLRSARKFAYQLNEQKHNEGSIVNVTFNSDDLNDISGIQNTFEVNTELAEIVAFNPVVSEMSSAHVNTEKMNEGIVNMSWYKSNAWAEGDNNDMFTLVLKIKKQAYTSDIIRLSQSHITPEAYFGNQVADVSIDFIVNEEISEAMSLYQNVPNPWSDNTEVKFYMPSNQNFVINVYDINGKLVYQEQNIAKKGINKVILSESDIDAGGILYYELISGNTRLMNKMLLIK